MTELYIGMMSGTSLDGVDAVVADCSVGSRLIAASHWPFAVDLRAELLALQAPTANEMHRSCVAANALAEQYAHCVIALLDNAGIAACEIRAIGCHGQTVRHQPAHGYTVQLVNAALIAEITGIDVICDFRSRDIAAGGQGAPLAPAFHAARFSTTETARAIVNIGGIANVTSLPAQGGVKGFDCGPGNVLMDAWISAHRGLAYDADGAWAVSGTSSPQLLERLLAHEFFSLLPPKSTGRETFNIAWLRSTLDGTERPEDVQATLLALTARTITEAIAAHYAACQEIYVCGGGARNSALLSQLAAMSAGCPVDTTDALGVAAEHVEALAFAWLAQRTLSAEAGNLPAVTGARGPRVLGALYRA